LIVYSELLWVLKQLPRAAGKPQREPGSDVRAFLLCAEHVRQLEGESPFDNLMEVKS
jgi:hypothetical protein